VLEYVRLLGAGTPTVDGVRLLEGVKLLEDVRLSEDVRLLETSTLTVEDDTGVTVLAAGIPLVRETMPSKINTVRRASRLVNLIENIMEECLYRCW
jgi:hypothetical protein